MRRRQTQTAQEQAEEQATKTAEAVEYAVSWGERIKADPPAAWEGLDPHEVSEIIKTSQKLLLIQGVGRAAKNHLIKIHRAGEILDNPASKLEKHMDELRLADAAEKRVLQSVGILASPTPSVMIQQIIDQSTTIHLDRAAEVALAHLAQVEAQGSGESDIIDMEGT